MSAQLSHQLKLSKLVGLHFKNIFLQIITLGIYRFWAKTNVRRHILSRIEFDGDSFEYTGTGKELFLGFLIVLFAVLLPIFIVAAGAQLLFANNPVILGIFMLILYTFIFWLVGAAVFRSRRYILSRILWRGIRFHQNGSWAEYASYFLTYPILFILSLGLAGPVLKMNLIKHMEAKMFVGDQQIEINTQIKGKLYKRYIPCLLLAIPTLGISLIWYKAFFMRTIFGESKLTGLSFEFNITTWHLIAFLFKVVLMTMILPLIAIMVGMIVISTQQKDISLFYAAVFIPYIGIIFTAISSALLKPYVWKLKADLITKNLVIHGKVDESITQSKQDKLTSGEGLADAFDVGAF